jgi:xanthine dehydrogenase accessory factor
MNRRSRAVLRQAAELAARGEPFALATVVWRQAPTSGKPGAKALVTADGLVHGWLGGACSEPVVVREALRCIRDGKGRLLHLGPAAEPARRDREGLVLEPLGCAGEGTVEVFVEPVLPHPRLVLVGDTPVLDALEEMAKVLDLDVRRSREPPSEAGRLRLPLESEAPRGEWRVPTFIVVATLGRYDEPALEAALATDAAYIGLVASRRRAEAVLAQLRDAGVEASQLHRIQAPAGLDLGPVDHPEIAVAILASIVAVKAALGSGGTAAAPPQEKEAVDPVCGMKVPADGSGPRAEWQGRTYRFCCDGCRRRFEADPERYLEPAARKGTSFS